MRKCICSLALLLVFTIVTQAQIAEAVHRVMGFDPPITNAGSSNSSVALLAGISSISTGAGPCDGAHSLAENCEIEPLYKGIKKVLLLEVALAGVQ